MNARVPSTAMVATQPAHPAVAGISTGAVMAIIPQTFDEVFRFAQVMARSGLCPHGMDTPEKVSVAILTGLEIGVKPMQALQGIAVIGGRPCVWGDLALGVVRGSGALEYLQETYEGDESACDWRATTPDGAMLEFKAVCRVKRAGQPEIVREFSVRDAVVAKLWGKKGYSGKDTPWITNPKRMLQMRARGFALRDGFADVLKGMLMAEELIGTDADNVFDPAPPPPPPAPENLLPPAPPPPPAALQAAAEPTAPQIPADVVERARREAEELQAQPKEQPRIVNEPVGLNDDEPVTEDPPETLESLLEELQHVLSTQTTEEEIEEAYTIIDAEARASAYEGGTEAVRNKKTAHLHRVGAGNKPLSERKPAEKKPADPAQAAEKPAGGSEAAIRAYQQKLQLAMDTAETVEEMEGFWSSTAEERDATGASDAIKLRWKSAKQQTVEAIRNGL